MIIVNLACQAVALPDGATPIMFARSGGEVVYTLKVDAQPLPESVTVRAYGRNWSELIPVVDGVVRVVIPPVRSAVVFSVALPGDPSVVFGELIAYPDGARPLPGKGIRIYTNGTPAWFDQWSRAVGIVVQPKSPEQVRGRRLPAVDVDGELLVIGVEGAGESIADTLRLAEKAQCNVLVLAAPWYGPPRPQEIIVEPGNMRGVLATIAAQSWPKPPVFRGANGAPGVVMNRSFWITGEHGPLVERLGARPNQRPVVVSYLPWAQQLGRNEVADELLLEVLRIAAGSLPEPRPLRRMIVLSADTDLGAPERTILAAASRATPAGDGVDILTVLDLRGDTTWPPRHRRALAELEVQVSPTDPLLILGDDRLLDTWSWLRMDRKKQRIKERPGLTWLQKDTIPPSAPARLRLMDVLTNYGVPLAPDQGSN